MDDCGIPLGFSLLVVNGNFMRLLSLGGGTHGSNVMILSVDGNARSLHISFIPVSL